jgi:DNA-binding XRE family transcriptional regulator
VRLPTGSTRHLIHPIPLLADTYMRRKAKGMKRTKEGRGTTLRRYVKSGPSRPRGLAGWRARLELSQRAAADVLGMSLRAYQELERGAAFGSELPRVPDRRTMLAAAAVLAGLTPLEIGP